MPFIKIKPREIEGNPFRMIGDQWFLLTAGDRERCNTMTCGWGGLGVLWQLDVATCYVRPQRYTFEFMNQSEYYTISFFGEQYRKQLLVCGTKSGRDTDKAAACGFTPAFAECGAPYFEEAELVLVCKKIYWADLDPGHFLDDRIAACYQPNDYHRVYVGEVIEVLKKD